MYTYGMTAVRLPDNIGGESADSVDSNVVNGQRGETGHLSRQYLEDDKGEGW